jgi:GNAT superfamily N-acetyltransferase
MPASVIAMSFRVVLHPTPAELLARARSTLMRNEAESSLLIGIAESLPSHERGPLLVTVEHEGEVVAVAMRTMPRKLLVSDGPPEAIDALGEAMREIAADLPGVTGPAAAAERFAQRFCRPTSPVSDPAPREKPSRRRSTSLRRAQLVLRMRLHQLDAVIEVPRPPGHVRVATPADATLLGPWAQRFVDESGSDETRPGAELLAPYLANGTLYLWEDGEPRSMAGWSRGTEHGAAISMVFTPPEHRGQGNATALVAALSRTILARGKRFCVLFTNLANPTANAIYARIGYRPLSDHSSWRFD